MKEMKQLNPDSFDDAYEILERNANKLSAEGQLKIDDLLPLVQESMVAYNICKNRLEAIRKALEEHLAPVDGEKPATTSAGAEINAWEEDEEKPSASGTKAKFLDDDFPF